MSMSLVAGVTTCISTHLEEMVDSLREATGLTHLGRAGLHSAHRSEHFDRLSVCLGHRAVLNDAVKPTDVGRMAHNQPVDWRDERGKQRQQRVCRVHRDERAEHAHHLECACGKGQSAEEVAVIWSDSRGGHTACTRFCEVN